MLNDIDTIDWMGDWMDKAMQDELEYYGEDMFADEEEAEQAGSFDLLELE